jgi:hypothetical protein
MLLGRSAPPASISQPLLNSPSVAPAPVDTSADVPRFVPIQDETTVILLLPVVPSCSSDSRAESKCRSVAVNDYWDCVNSERRPVAALRNSKLRERRTTFFAIKGRVASTMRRYGSNAAPLYPHSYPQLNRAPIKTCRQCPTPDAGGL